jgi:hypothetical protein
MARASLIIVSGLAALAACYVLMLSPALRAERAAVVSTPGLGGLNIRSVVEVGAGQKACTWPVYLAPEVSRVQYVLAGTQASADGIQMTVTGASLAGKQTGATVQPVATDTLLTISFSPTAARVGQAAKVCLRPMSGALNLVGTDEPRSAVTAATKVDGKPIQPDVTVVLLGPPNLTTSEALRKIPERVSATTLGLVPTWLVWILAISMTLLALLMPLAGLVWADHLSKSN